MFHAVSNEHAFFFLFHRRDNTLMPKRERGEEGSKPKSTTSTKQAKTEPKATTTPIPLGASSSALTSSSSSSSAAASTSTTTTPPRLRNSGIHISSGASSRARFWKAIPISGIPSTVHAISEATPVVAMSPSYTYHLGNNSNSVRLPPPFSSHAIPSFLPREFEEQITRGFALPVLNIRTYPEGTTLQQQLVGETIRNWLRSPPNELMPSSHECPAYCKHEKEFPIEVPDEHTGEPFGLADSTCVICFDSNVQTFTSCGHLIMCIKCARDMGRVKPGRVNGNTKTVEGKTYCEHCYKGCPQCRKPLTFIKRLYISK